MDQNDVHTEGGTFAGWVPAIVWFVINGAVAFLEFIIEDDLANLHQRQLILISREDALPQTMLKTI